MNKQLKNDKDKRLMAASVYFNLYIDSLEEFVNEVGDIYIRESGNIMILIEKKRSRCWVYWEFWYEFSEKFSLQKNEVKSFITRWVEDTYHLKGIDITCLYPG